MAITLFPLLVSNTISKNIVPGVVKVLENYIIVYGLDSILDQLRTERGTKGNYRISNNKVIKRENVSSEVSNFLYNEILEEAEHRSKAWDIGGGTKGKGQPQSQTKPGFSYVSGAGAEDEETEREAAAKERGKLSAQAKDATIRLDTFNMESIGLEPTWMKMDQIDKDGTKTTGIIGVKVIPYLVKSDASLANLLMYDKQVKGLQRYAIKKGRSMTSWLYNFWKKRWIGKVFGGSNDTVTGDPRQDIILKRSIMNSKDIQSIFALANQSELSDDFISTAKGMKSLQGMGWGSLIVADDVNKRVAFCMKELKGMCSMMPYTMLYQTFSQAKVYEDIEDAKRTASSIFKIRRQKLTKLIGENIAETKVEGFGSQNLPLLESDFIAEAEYIDENIASFMKKITPARIKTIIPNILKGKVKNIPSTTPDKVVKLATKLNPEFRKGYLLARKVIANSSPQVSEELVDWAAIAITLRASIKKGADFMTEIKSGLKKFIKLFRRSEAKVEAQAKKTGMPKEHLVDATFGWIYIGMLLSGAVSIAGALNYVIFKTADFRSLLYRTVNIQLGQTNAKLVNQTAEDWGELAVTVGKTAYSAGEKAVEVGKEHLIEFAPWIAFILVVSVIMRKLLKN